MSESQNLNDFQKDLESITSNLHRQYEAILEFKQKIAIFTNEFEEQWIEKISNQLTNFEAEVTKLKDEVILLSRISANISRTVDYINPEQACQVYQTQLDSFNHSINISKESFNYFTEQLTGINNDLQEHRKRLYSLAPHKRLGYFFTDPLVMIVSTSIFTSVFNFMLIKLLS